MGKALKTCQLEFLKVFPESFHDPGSSVMFERKMNHQCQDMESDRHSNLLPLAAHAGMQHSLILTCVDGVVWEAKSHSE